jgi:hypothetical protein
MVKDYRTHITGISAEDLDGVTCTLANIQVLISICYILYSYLSITYFTCSVRIFWQICALYNMCMQVMELYHMKIIIS